MTMLSKPAFCQLFTLFYFNFSFYLHLSLMNNQPVPYRNSASCLPHLHQRFNLPLHPGEIQKTIWKKLFSLEKFCHMERLIVAVEFQQPFPVSSYKFTSSYKFKLLHTWILFTTSTNFQAQRCSRAWNAEYLAKLSNDGPETITGKGKLIWHFHDSLESIFF